MTTMEGKHLFALQNFRKTKAATMAALRSMGVEPFEDPDSPDAIFFYFDRRNVLFCSAGGPDTKLRGPLVA